MTDTRDAASDDTAPDDAAPDQAEPADETTTSTTGGKVRSVATAAVSQGLSAGSNFVIVLALGRGGGSHTLGEYTLAFVVYNAALGLHRALVTDSLLARPFHAPASYVEDARAATVSLSLALLAGLVVVLAGILTPYHQLTVLAAFLPILLLEDLCRYLLFRRQQPKAAALIDGIWAAMSCAGFFYLLHHATTRRAIIVWGLGGVLAAIAGVLVARLRLAEPRTALRWWRDDLWKSSRWLTLEAALFHTDQQLTAFGFTAMAGAAAFGDWQATESLLGVAAFLNVGLVVMSVTHFGREAGDKRVAAYVSLSSVCFVILLTLGLVLIAPWLIPLLFHKKVHLPASMIIPTGVFLAMGSAATGPIALVRARRTEGVLPLARGVALLGFSPLAVIVARHHFIAALWILAVGAFAYLAVVAVPAFGHADEPDIDAPEFALTEADHEFIA